MAGRWRLHRLGVVRGTAVFGETTVDGGVGGRSVIGRVEADGTWAWVVKSDTAAGHRLAVRTLSSVVSSGEGSVDVVGPDWIRRDHCPGGR